MYLEELEIIDSQKILNPFLITIADNFGFQSHEAIRILVDSQVEIEEIFEKLNSQHGIAVNGFYKRHYNTLCKMDERFQKARTAGKLAPHIYRQLICLVYLENRLRQEAIARRPKPKIMRKPKPKFVVLWERVKEFAKRFLESLIRP